MHNAVCFFSKAVGEKNATFFPYYLQRILLPVLTKACGFSKPETIILLVITEPKESKTHNLEKVNCRKAIEYETHIILYQQ